VTETGSFIATFRLCVDTNTIRSKSHPVLGCFLGILCGLFPLLLPLISFVFRGPAVLERLGISFLDLVALYLVGGAVGGTLVGFILPLTRWRWGAVFAGILAALPLYWGAGIFLGNLDPYGDTFLAIVIGGAVGFSWWEPVRESGRERHNQAPFES
jgi:MFS family permease